MKAIIGIFICASLLFGCSEGVLRTSSTTTAPVKHVTVVAVGDISCSKTQRNSGNYPCADAEVASLVRSQQPDHLLLLGDIQYQSHTAKNFKENFGVIWSDLLSISKPIAGNHEYAEGGAKGYYETWASYPRPGYYSFHINDDWLLLGMNTNDKCKFVPCGKKSTQYKWLESELDNNANKCVVVMAHHPRYSSGLHGSSSSMKDAFELMESSGVDILLSGHDHNYERFSTKPVQFVVGTGGKDLRRVGKPIDGSVFLSNKHHGALVMKISKRTAELQFLNTDGVTIDKTRVDC
jgi:calcineurin-like phosphoesterase family protein